MFAGYYKDPEATAAAFTDDGWFRTGDVGEIDADGFLKITDRKKDLIITAGGKNIAPQNLENALKASRFVSQALIVGDRRPYITALITLDQAEVDATGRDPQELVQAIVDDVNRDRVRVEQIKRFAILPRDFTQEDGEVTPTLKLRRKIVHEHFADEIDELYSLTAGFLIASAFLASAVEFVEALTIVLAAGVTRGWRSALAGLGRSDRSRSRRSSPRSGPALTLIPLDALRLVVGGAAARLRAAVAAQGDPARERLQGAPRRGRRSSRASSRRRARAGREQRAGLDWYGFTLAFKGVLLEGLEVAFIVRHVRQRRRAASASPRSAPAAALVLVAIVGVLVARAARRACPRTRSSSRSA